MVVWGGGNLIPTFFNTGGRYCAQTGPTPTPNCNRNIHSDSHADTDSNAMHGEMCTYTEAAPNAGTSTVMDAGLATGSFCPNVHFGDCAMNCAAVCPHVHHSGFWRDNEVVNT